MTVNQGVSAEDMIGPYYPIAFVRDDPASLQALPGLIVAPQGQPVILTGSVVGFDGKPVVPMLVELWQADHRGKRHGFSDSSAVDPWFPGHARIYSDDGSFRLETILPGAAPEQEGAPVRAPYVTINIFADGISRLATQIFFEGVAENAEDPLLQSVPPSLRDRLIAKKQGGGSEADEYHIALILRGEGETPFFEDYYE